MLRCNSLNPAKNLCSLAKNTRYIWDSARVSDGALALLRSMPAEFELNNVAPDKDLILSYSAVSLATPKPRDKN